jgi:hypothetical protein
MAKKGYSLREIIDELRQEELEKALYKLKNELSNDNLKDQDIIDEITEIGFADENLSKFEKNKYIRKKINHFNDLISGEFISLDADRYNDKNGFYDFPEEMKHPIKDILRITDSDNGNFIKKYHEYNEDIEKLEEKHLAAYREYIESGHSKKEKKS